jgi:hypothetical protein
MVVTLRLGVSDFSPGYRTSVDGVHTFPRGPLRELLVTLSSLKGTLKGSAKEILVPKRSPKVSASGYFTGREEWKNFHAACVVCLEG